jgi:hypothetical protein
LRICGWEIPVTVVTLVDGERMMLQRQDTDPDMEKGLKLCFAAEFASNLDTEVGAGGAEDSCAPLKHWHGSERTPSLPSQPTSRNTARRSLGPRWMCSICECDCDCEWAWQTSGSSQCPAEPSVVSCLVSCLCRCRLLAWRTSKRDRRGVAGAAGAEAVGLESGDVRLR